MTWSDVRGGNPVKDALEAGRSVVGAFIRMPAVEVAEVFAHAGCDFVIVDMEHAPVSWERAAAMLVAAEAAGTTPVLRVSVGARDAITRALDAGAHGIMVPQVDSAESTAAVVAATRYGPDGTRGTAANRRFGYAMRMSYGEYVAAANAAALVVVQVESVAAVKKVDEIATVPGVDCVFVGLADLAVDLDLAGQWDHPEVRHHVDHVIDTCRGLGVPSGVPVTTGEMAREYLRRGVRFIAAGDVGLLAGATRTFLEEVRSSDA